MKNMKNYLFSLLAVAAIGLTSCEGPMGPPGIDGTDGTDGTDGVAGNNSCLVCHTQAKMDSIQEQYDISGHGIGAYVAYTSGTGRSSCGRCHHDEGFKYYLDSILNADHSGNLAVPTDMFNTTKIDCETCHNNHSSLEDGIGAPIRTTYPVTSIEGNAIVMDFKNNSNLCANCHQSRASYQQSEAITSVTIGGVATNVPDGSVGITSSRTGPHHGPQANILVGQLGYGTSSINNAHKDKGCVGCHMGKNTGEEGGHTFFPNIDNCKSCHPTATNFDIGGTQTSFDTRMSAIRAKLVEGGILDDATSLAKSPGIYTDALFRGYWNWISLTEDKSRGVHNPGYIETMLTVAETNLGLK